MGSKENLQVFFNGGNRVATQPTLIPPLPQWCAGGAVYKTGSLSRLPALGRSTLCRLASEAQGFDDASVTLDVVVFDIVQESSAPADHHQKPPAGMMILFVGFQVLGQV